MDMEDDHQRYALFRRPLAPRYGRGERSVSSSAHNRQDFEESHRLHTNVKCLQVKGKERDARVNRLFHELHDHRTWLTEQLQDCATKHEDLDVRHRQTQRLLMRVLKNFDELKSELEGKCEHLWEKNMQLAKASARAQGQYLTNISLCLCMLILSLSLPLSEKHKIEISAYRTSLEESKNLGEQLQEAVQQQCWSTKEQLNKLSQKTKGMPELRHFTKACNKSSHNDGCLEFHEHQIQSENATDLRLLEFKAKVDEVLQAARGKSIQNDISWRRK
ncbi:hypothetical protein DFH28DRAFT_924707 [Melampsora americana]|nr:hypothetical protein DFH28DRAFT_924707 [Melampsora americana]